MSTKNGNPDTITWPDSPQTEEEVIRSLKASPMLYRSYQNLSPTWKQDFLDFCRGKKSLPLTYDPFFKQIFHPDIHPDRLSRLISSFLGIEMKVVDILPTSDSILNGNIMFIMDILARLEDGSYVDVEIQKSPYPFPAERISCYISDLIMRQYSHVRGIKGKAFTYQDIKRAYVIVIYEKSPEMLPHCS